MADEQLPTNASTLDLKSLVKELEVPFSPNQVQWRVTNTAKDRKRGQVVPYADPRAYADRLNALFTPQGWTREYRVETLSNITRIKGGESVITGKILVTCTVTIIGLWSHSGTGEEWAEDSNAMTAADAQAFKRACSCFGLGRYLYEFHGSWVDLDRTSNQSECPRSRPGRFQRIGGMGSVLRESTEMVTRGREVARIARGTAGRSRTGGSRHR